VVGVVNVICAWYVDTGDCVTFFVSCFTKLYASTFFQLIIGLMGMFGLYSFIGAGHCEHNNGTRDECSYHSQVERRQKKGGAAKMHNL
jgi:hypothetical protein